MAYCIIIIIIIIITEGVASKFNIQTWFKIQHQWRRTRQGQLGEGTRFLQEFRLRKRCGKRHIPSEYIEFQLAPHLKMKCRSRMHPKICE